MLSQYRFLQWMFHSSVLSSTPNPTRPSNRRPHPRRAVPAAAQHEGPCSRPEVLSGTARSVSSRGNPQTQETHEEKRRESLQFGYGISSYWEQDISDDLHTEFPTTGEVKSNRSPIIQVLDFLSLIITNSY